MECIQEHHPYESEKKLGSRTLGILNRICAYMRRDKRVRTQDENPKSRRREGNEIGAEMLRGGKDLLGVPWILEPGGPVRVPLYHTCPIQHSLHDNQTG